MLDRLECLKYAIDNKCPGWEKYLQCRNYKNYAKIAITNLNNNHYFINYQQMGKYTVICSLGLGVGFYSDRDCTKKIAQLPTGYQFSGTIYHETKVNNSRVKVITVYSSDIDLKKSEYVLYSSDRLAKKESGVSKALNSFFSAPTIYYEPDTKTEKPKKFKSVHDEGWKEEMI